MKKSAVHFKIAAWSIKNPGQMYAITAAGLIFLLLLCVLATSMIVKNNSKTLSFPSQVVTAGRDAGSSFERAGWSITGQKMVAGRQCISYKNSTNGTRLTSCYVQNGKEWVFQQSF